MRRAMIVSTIVSSGLNTLNRYSVLSVRISLWLVLLTSCGGGDISSTGTFGAPSASVEAALADDDRDFTAKESYPMAQREAVAWHDDAVLYAIMPSYAMAQNLGVDFGDEPGWVFKFGRPEGRMELFVHIAGGEVRSIVQAHPVYLEPPPELLPIDMEHIPLDSPQVLEFFVAQDGLQYLAQHSDARLDYELLHLTGIANPVWTLWDDSTAQALLHVDAVTGEMTQDPHRAM